MNSALTDIFPANITNIKEKFMRKMSENKFVIKIKSKVESVMESK
jgi:hypothetical protein